MNLAPLLAAPAIIQIHVAAATGAIVLGAAQFILPKGRDLHRRMGWVWAVLMIVVAGTSFWISKERFGFGPFSPIHLLSILALVTVPLAVWAARRRQIHTHRKAMITIYAMALVLTGLFTLLPYRILGRALFG